MQNAGARVTVPLPVFGRVLEAAVLLTAILVLPATATEWTVGVYMCADNGMNEQSYADIAELAETGSSQDVNFVVQVDRSATDSLAGCRRYYIARDHVEPLRELGETDMADPQTLIDFASYLAQYYPARNYALVLWDHGNGWTQSVAGGPGSPGNDRGWPHRSIFIDASGSGSTMSVAGGELARALAGASAALGKRIRLLGFDACFMGMAEVAAEASGSCDYMVAAEGLAPLGGWPYDEFASLVTHGYDQSPAAWLPALCSAYVAQYPGEDVSLSALDLGRLDHALGLWAQDIDVRSAGDPALHDARAHAQTFSDNSQRPPVPADDQIDLIDFWRRIPGGGAVAAALDSVVVANTTGGALSNARGLACWFPARYLALKYTYKPYLGLRFADAVSWLQFLNRYFGADDIRPEQPHVVTVQPGSANSVRLWWNRCFDLAPVSYQVQAARDLTMAFSDDCDSLGRWRSVGWTVSDVAHSGLHSLASGAGSNRADTLELVLADTDSVRLIEFYARFNTEETADSTGIRHDACYVERLDGAGWHVFDSLYGRQDSWLECRYLVLPSGGSGTRSVLSDNTVMSPGGLRFRYVTGTGANSGSVYIDDVRLYEAPGLRSVTAENGDTTALISDLARDLAGQRFIVTARDSFGNAAMASRDEATAFDRYAEPYSVPGPFGDSCSIVIDAPAGAATVSIYTLSGVLVRRFADTQAREIAWDGRNDAGRAVANGVYLVAVEMDGFRSLGRIAKVAR